MPDKHIDCQEVSEYGRYFYNKSERLEGASPLVDIRLLRQRVLAVVEEAERYRTTTMVERSTVRGGRGNIGVASARLASDVRRFRHHVRAQPEEAGLDEEAFFPGGYVTPAKRKPADLLAQGRDILAGFDAPANASLVNAAEWRATFAVSCASLDAALVDKHGAAHVASAGTEAQAETRRKFLALYNGMAKRLVRVVLQDIGRLQDYRMFFLDLQVNEDGQAAPEAPYAPDAPETPAL
jgi:hypothetical protein